MIKVTVELVSSRTGKISLLGVAMIANDGASQSSSRGNYDAEFRLKRKRIWRKGRVTGYPRHSLNVWYLIHRLLGDALK